IAAFAIAALVLVPVALAYSGANVDDWWDLSFVRGWIASGHLGFEQMALSPDPESGASAIHPRFLWNVWLLVQTLVSRVCGGEAWRMQAGPLTAIVMLLVVSAQCALGKTLF